MKEKILVALSDSGLALHLSEKLLAEGFLPLVVSTGPETLEKMKSDMPVLAVIDLVLPVKDGYEVLNDKTLDRFITKIPVIVVSNSGSAIEMRRIPTTPSIKNYIIRTHVEPLDIVQKICAVLERPCKSDAPPQPIKINSPVKKILWVEDDKFLSNIIVKKFEASGHNVIKAENAEDAMAALQTGKPDIIVLDILLPGNSGFKFLQTVKMNENLRSVPVVVFSNIARPGDIEKAKMLGAQKFLVKAAVSLDEMVREIEQLS